MRSLKATFLTATRLSQLTHSSLLLRKDAPGHSICSPYVIDMRRSRSTLSCCIAVLHLSMYVELIYAMGVFHRDFIWAVLSNDRPVDQCDGSRKDKPCYHQDPREGQRNLVRRRFIAGNTVDLKWYHASILLSSSNTVMLVRHTSFILVS